MKKEEQIRMLLNSEQYTEEQLDKMLEDSHIPAPNVDKEWQRFKTKTQAKQSKQHKNKPMQWAATLAILAALSGISYATISHFVSAKEDTNVTTTTVVDEKENFNNENARKIRLYLSWEADDKLQDIVNRINHFEKVHLTLSDETITIE